MPDSASMNPYQAAVAKSYADGEFAWLVDRTDWADQLPACGDTLFAFLMLELATSEDCTDKAEALRRLRTASHNLVNAILAVASVSEHGGSLQ